MSYLVLARKWRPQLFEEVVAQKHVTRTLQNALAGNRVAHALLFTGTRGVGKTSVARILAKALNCHEGPSPRPCNRCQSCMDITAGASMDVLEIDGASNTGVEDVRGLRENVRYLPSKGKYKVYIIDEVHMLSNSAFNALLKTLEEPPRHVVFVFATTEPHKIPSTILSRCQRYDFKGIPTRDILAQLKIIVSDEKVKISDKSLSLIARKAEGSMRDAQSIFDQAISFAGKDITDDEIVEILGVIDRKLLYETSLSIVERKPEKCLDIIEDVYNYGYDIKEFYKDLLEHFRNLIVAKITKNPSRLIELPEDEIHELVSQGDSLHIDDLQRLFRILSASEEEIIRSINPKLVMEMTLVRMAYARPLRSIDDILARVSHLEKKLLNSQSNSSDESSVLLKRQQTPNPTLERSTGPENDNLEVADDNNTPEPGIKEPDIQRTWQDLIAFIRKRRPFLASILDFGQLLGLYHEKIDIGFKDDSMFLDSINEPQNKKDLEDICREFFHREVTVCVSAITSDSGSVKETGGRGFDRVGEERCEALNHPVIQDALSILGGNITEIKTEQV